MELIKTTPKEVMQYKTVTITKVDNGYLASCVKTNLGGPPTQEDLVFTDFTQVLNFLSPQRAKAVQ